MLTTTHTAKTPLIWLVIALISLGILTTKTASASDIPIEIYVTGQLTMALHGSWSSGLNFPSAPIMNQNLNLGWTSNPNNDYIEYADDTATAGFYITLSMTDFTYTGDSQSQAALPANNFKLIGTYTNGQAATATIGNDDMTKTVSIDPSSCAGATPGTYTLNSNLTNSGTNYSITGATSSNILVESSASCTNIGHLRFDRATLLLPQNSALGSYSSTMTITIIDGQP